MALLPMFPLGTVLFPTVVLPLQVFEPRYRTLVRHCLAGEPEFGVVLIERGSEVGGGDVRTEVGTVARIMDHVELPDGRFALAVLGERRVRVTTWLPDDPYPIAEVENWPDPDVEDPNLSSQVEVTVAALRRVLAIAAEMGANAASATVELSGDPVLASYQAAALSPFGPLDHHRLLAAPSASARLSELRALLIDEEFYFGMALGRGGSPPKDPGESR